MSAVVEEHVYRVANTGWVHCHGHEAQEISAWPRLEHGALVVLDLDEIFTDVWRFEGKSEYATALIEKRVRTQGLVEGVAHIVLHRLVKVPGGFQAYFSAVPLDLWQRCIQWANEQVDHCLVMTVGGLLCHGVNGSSARLLLSQRRLMCFAHTEEGMVFGSMQALGSGVPAMVSSAQVLMGNQRALLTRIGFEAVEWGVLWTMQATDGNACLAVVQDVLGGAPTALPSVEMTLSGERMQTVLPELARASAGQHALNPLSERLAWRAERWVSVISVVTALAGVVLVAVGVLVAQQVNEQRMAVQSQRAELEALQSRIQLVATVEPPQKLLPAAEFSLTLDQGAKYDPMAFMASLKATAGKNIRIQRVRLDAVAQTRARAFRVDGVMEPGASASVTHWVSQMAALGWSLKALDPTDGAPGAFSYELVAVAAAPGSVKP